MYVRSTSLLSVWFWWTLGNGMATAAAADDYEPSEACGVVWGARTSRELLRLKEADQHDRQHWGPRVAARDARRLGRVQALAEQGAICTPVDHFHAAVLLQHSADPEDHRLAHVYATYAARKVGWWGAAAFDRWQVSRGLPQWYGTQYRGHEGRSCLIHIDPAATDGERVAVGVPTLSEQIEAAQTVMNQGEASATTLTELEALGLYCEPVAWPATP
jgi:hypothetical protein